MADDGGNDLVPSPIAETVATAHIGYRLPTVLKSSHAIVIRVLPKVAQLRLFFLTPLRC